MRKVQTTHGIALPKDWLMMSAEPAKELYSRLWRNLIEQSLQNTLNQCDFFPEDVTSIMQEGHIKLTITATSYEQKKTPEKSGAT